MKRCVIAVLFICWALPSFAQPSHIDTSIRRVKWSKVLAHDHKHFKCYPDGGEAYEYIHKPYTEFLHAPDGMNGGGFFDSALYLDLNGDGLEDAILNFSSPGSGIWGSIVVFLQSKSGPKFVGWDGNSHYEIELHGDTIVTITDHFLLDDPNCCTRAHDVRRFLAKGMRLDSLPMTVEPAEHGGIRTLIAYYEELGYGYCESAYEILSPSYRQNHNYEEWLHETNRYTYDKYHNVEVDWNSADSAVHFKLSATDRDGIKHLFEGTWHPCWDATQNDWFLDRPEIHEVK